MDALLPVSAAVIFVTLGVNAVKVWKELRGPRRWRRGHFFDDDVRTVLTKGRNLPTFRK